MTPVQMEVMLHWFYRCDLFASRNSGMNMAQVDATQHLVANGMIEKLGKQTALVGDQPFVTTDRGNAYVKALQSVQLPVQRWEVPK